MIAIYLVGKATILLAFALGLDLLLRRRAVLACAAMWNAALVSLVLLPAAVLLLPALPLAVWSVAIESASTPLDRPAPQRIQELVEEPKRANETSQGLADMASPAGKQKAWSWPSPASSLAALYLAGVTIGLLRLATSLGAVVRLRADALPVTCPHWQARLAYWTGKFPCGGVELRHSDRIHVPLMLGWPRPAIIIPRSMMADLDRKRRDAILVHELAHVLRGDFAWQVLLRLVQSALWFHPLIWLAERRIGFIRERACDEFSIHTLGDRQVYGETLLDIASRIVRRPSLGLALAVLRTPQIAKRIEALAESAGSSRCTPAIPTRLLALLVCLGATAAVGSVQLVAAQQSNPRVQSAPTQVSEQDPAPASDKTNQVPRTMEVRVIGPEDQPLAGAEIHVSLWTKEPIDRNRDFVCDADGKTKFELPNQIEILRVWARHQGHVGMFAQWWPEKEATPRDIPKEYTYRLAKGTSIGGLVKNENGQPIAGAKVQVQLVGPLGQAQQRELDVRAIPNSWLAEGEAAKVTDTSGRWSLDNVPAGDDAQVRLMLGHPDYISESTWGALQQAQGVTMPALRDGSATIIMARGVSVSGTVTDPDGKPVPQAIVVWSEDPYMEWGSQEVRTDVSGKYQLPPLAAGPLTLTVISEGWAPDQRKIDLAANLISDFQLKPGKITRFRFVDDSGAPIPEVGVAIDRWRYNKALYNHIHSNVLNTKIPTKADPNGVYEWTWSPGDAVTYIFYKEGFPRFSGHPQQTFTAGEGEHLITAARNP